MKRLLPFAIAGAFGYAVDASVLSFCIGWLGPIGGRALSFACAVLMTWLINRNFAFADRAAAEGKHYEFLRYLLAMIPGGAINWMTYGLAMALLPSGGWKPALAVGIGSLAGMLTNLTAAHTLVFRAHKQG
ncbi:hypothetical protein WH87_17420 [Devosia epidermidihirudinis]|uniref:GtrA/DPMS transmembrane domain-containing protein n=1 Tax=Devosia epidermidihirudinis TaxID=1293439 RepID=A0A0F5Q5K2_9HYPH|nr:GtrA family protein [Devosia epidermidihirudinis]KKC35349.1 hypothetical protein WH87_17420 [Devosia epidermidihirudinis]